MRWNYTPVSAAGVERLGRELGVGRTVAELLLRLGLGEPQAAGSFLAPALASLGDPFAVASVDAAVARLRRALERNERVAVLGDYDVDGVSSTALLVSILRRLGLAPRYAVPRRLEEGYGLTRTAIDRVLEAGPIDLFVALDCGTNSRDEVAYLRGRGSEVIVIDHHRSREEPGLDAVLVNPHVANRAGDDAWRHLCTVGLVFKVVHGLLKELRDAGHAVAPTIRLRDYLDLVALGTVADLVPLTGENRVLARHGLKVLAGTERPGLRALMMTAGLKPEQDIMPVDISYRLGPRINASGRLADAAISVDLLLSDDRAFCDDAARQLNEFNRERQDIERDITTLAERFVDTHFADSAGFVLYDEGWHPGVVGIVAGRISRKYNRPAIVLGNEGELAKGSGRGIPGTNLVEVLAACSDILESWGGHPMAVGVSLRKPRLDEFRGMFDRAIRERHGGVMPEATLELAGWLDGTEVREGLLQGIDQLHPFGQGNPEPVFGIRGLRLRTPAEVFKDQHYRFSAYDVEGRRISGVAWKQADRLPPVGRPLEMAVQLNWNNYNGRRFLQIELLDWRDPEQNSA